MAGLIYALDTDTVEDAVAWAKRLKAEVDVFKVGYKLFTAAGPGVVKALHEKAGVKIFLDLKFHDIPFTVAEAAEEATKMGVFMFNVHALGGEAMMKAAADKARETAQKLKVPAPKVIAVTVLTSLTKEDLQKINFNLEELIEKLKEYRPVQKENLDKLRKLVGEPRQQVLRQQVLKLAGLAQKSHLDGVVASVKETRAIRKALGKDFLIVTPGIRLPSSKPDDQARTATPQEAVSAGANWIVVGRPIRDAKDPVEAARTIKSSLEKPLRP